MTSCILTIIKDEQLYLDEFIKYHLGLGIDHIFIFEDCTSSSHKSITDNYSTEKVTLLNILDCWDTQEERDRIYYHRTHLFKMQNRYLKRSLLYIKNNYKYDWCFVIDVDEYITIENNDKLNNILNEFIDYDAIILYWENYGANGLIYKPDYNKKGIIETYTKVANNQKSDINRNIIKTVYNLSTYTNDSYGSQHYPNFKTNWCNTNLIKDLKKPTYNKIYIRHYITKSWEEYVTKIKLRGMFFWHHRKLESFFDINEDMIDKKEELLNLVDNIIKKEQS